MNITYILTALDAGGVGIVSRTLVNQMIEIGHNVTLVALNRGHNDQAVSSPTVIFPYHQTNASVFLLSFLRLCIYFARNRNIQSIIVASDYPAIITILACKLTRHPARILVNSHTTVSVYAASQSRFKQALLGAARILYRKADFVCNVSQGAAADSATFFNLPHVHTLYNPACDDAMLSYVPPHAPHPWLSNPGLKCIISCGRLAPEKNISLMLKAFAEVSARQPGLRLLILGDGEQKEELIQQARELNVSSRVAFTGHVSNPRDYFYFARGLWLTSYYEGLPTVLIEAMATGIPCIAVNCPSGPAEVLENGVYGKLVEGWDVKKNASAMLGFLQEEPKPRSFYKQRAAFFGIENRTQAYLKLLENRT